MTLLIHMMNMFSFLRNCPSVFQCGSMILYFHQECMGYPISPHFYQFSVLSQLFFSFSCFNNYVLVSIMILIFVYLIAGDVEYLTMCLFAMSEMSFMSFAHFLLGFVFNVEFESSLYIVDMNPLSDWCFANIFYQCVTYFFILFTGLLQSTSFYF